MTKLAQSTLDAIAAAVAQALAQAAASAPVAPSAASGPAFDATGRTCVCGHEHKRPVVASARERLASETACAIKGCVSTSCGR